MRAYVPYIYIYIYFHIIISSFTSELNSVIHFSCVNLIMFSNFYCHFQFHIESNRISLILVSKILLFTYYSKLNEKKNKRIKAD